MHSNPKASNSETMREFSATELHGYLDTVAEQPLLLDVREPWEFDKASIDGSILIPMRSVPHQLQELELGQGNHCYLPPWYTQPHGMPVP